MKLPWNRPKAPPSVLRTGLCSPLACALGLPAVCEVKEVVVESGAARNMGLRGHKGVALVPKSEEVQKSFQEPVWSGKPSGTTQEKVAPPLLCYFSACMALSVPLELARSAKQQLSLSILQTRKPYALH